MSSSCEWTLRSNVNVAMFDVSGQNIREITSINYMKRILKGKIITNNVKTVTVCTSFLDDLENFC